MSTPRRRRRADAGSRRQKGHWLLGGLDRDTFQPLRQAVGRQLGWESKLRSEGQRRVGAVYHDFVQPASYPPRCGPGTEEGPDLDIAADPFGGVDDVLCAAAQPLDRSVGVIGRPAVTHRPRVEIVGQPVVDDLGRPPVPAADVA